MAVHVYSGSLMPDRRFNIEIEQETDGRWIAEVIDLPGVVKYGNTREEALAAAEALALRVVADQIEESKSATASVSFVCQ
jgi:predicted RNase H-like HicB family nuclease